MASESNCNLTSYESVESTHVTNVLFAVPKKGRLYEKCLGLLAGAGMQYTRPNRLDIAECTNMPVTLVFLPAADIATYVAEGNVDIGITGLDVVQESEADVNQIMRLGFGKCKLCVLAPVSSHVTDPKSLVGKRVVTSFPKLAGNYFSSAAGTGSEETHIKFVSGSVEAACGLGLADAVVDLVETGTTMKAAGLEIVSTILESESLLISSKTTKHPVTVERIRKRIEGYITATNYLLISYNILRSNLPAAIKVTPGKRAPTISALDSATEDAVAVSCLVKAKDSSSIMDSLEIAGATDILLVSLTNSRM